MCLTLKQQKMSVKPPSFASLEIMETRKINLSEAKTKNRSF